MHAGAAAAALSPLRGRACALFGAWLQCGPRSRASARVHACLAVRCAHAARTPPNAAPYPRAATTHAQVRACVLAIMLRATQETADHLRSCGDAAAAGALEMQTAALRAQLGVAGAPVIAAASRQIESWLPHLGDGRSILRLERCVARGQAQGRAQTEPARAEQRVAKAAAAHGARARAREPPRAATHLATWRLRPRAPVSAARPRPRSKQSAPRPPPTSPRACARRSSPRSRRRASCARARAARVDCRRRSSPTRSARSSARGGRCRDSRRWPWRTTGRAITEDSTCTASRSRSAAAPTTRRGTSGRGPCARCGCRGRCARARPHLCATPPGARCRLPPSCGV